MEKQSEINDIHTLIIAIKKEENPILLSYDMYNWLFNSNWNCVLSDKIKEYSNNHKVIRGDKK